MRETSAAVSTLPLDHLRLERGLRTLKPEEEGTNIYHLPNGVYGFSFAPGLKEVPVYTKQPYHAFEIHRLANGEIHVVGFVTAETLAKTTGGKESVQAVIYPAPWEQSTELISVSDSRMQPARKAVTREDGNPFKTLIFPAAFTAGPS